LHIYDYDGCCMTRAFDIIHMLRIWMPVWKLINFMIIRSRASGIWWHVWLILEAVIRIDTYFNWFMLLEFEQLVYQKCLVSRQPISRYYHEWCVMTWVCYFCFYLITRVLLSKRVSSVTVLHDRFTFHFIEETVAATSYTFPT
jgi:hypothetical protein